METLIIPALVVVLILLIAAWYAQRERYDDPIDAAGSPEPHPTWQSPTLPTAPPEANDLPMSQFEWESLEIARRGEARADGLDFFGYLVIVLAVLTAIGASVAVLADRDELSSGERAAIALSAGGMILGLAAVAALLSGFAALVRNSSRSLAWQATQGRTDR